MAEVDVEPVEIPVTTGFEKLALRSVRPKGINSFSSSLVSLEFSPESVAESVCSSEAVVLEVFGVDVPELVKTLP